MELPGFGGYAGRNIAALEFSDNVRKEVKELHDPDEKPVFTPADITR
jgi:hypothetical protein